MLMQDKSNSAGLFEIYALSEKAITLDFGSVIDETLLKQVTDFKHILSQHPFPGLIAVVPAYASLSIFYEPVAVYKSSLPGINSYDKVSAYLQSLAGKNHTPLTHQSSVINIPACYGNNWGPDLDYVAGINNLSTDEVIKLHSAAEYKVYMIGFIPGFAYLGGMAEAIAAPRKPSPRRYVPAGSIGIAGNQTGIYPLDSPGGWQVIAQTPLKMFDANRANPSLLKAGDIVKFQPVSFSEFRDIVENPGYLNAY